MVRDSVGPNSVDGATNAFHKRLQRFFDLGLRILLVVVCLPTFLSFFSRLNWTLDNLTSFVVQYAAMSGGLLILCLLLGRWRLAAAATVLLLVNAFRVMPEPLSPLLAHGEPLTIVSANVHTSNRQFSRFVNLVCEANPNILLVVETNHDWEEALRPLRKNFPHVGLHGWPEKSRTSSPYTTLFVTIRAHSDSVSPVPATIC